MPFQEQFKSLHLAIQYKHRQHNESAARKKSEHFSFNRFDLGDRQSRGSNLNW
jgi:hypothetical protein